MMWVSVNTQWRQLCDAIEKLEREIDSANFPCPTPQMCEFLNLRMFFSNLRHQKTTLHSICSGCIIDSHLTVPTSQ